MSKDDYEIRDIGSFSYHFNEPLSVSQFTEDLNQMITSNSYIDYTRASGIFFNDMQSQKIYFKNTKWYEKQRLFTGIIDYHD